MSNNGKIQYYHLPKLFLQSMTTPMMGDNGRLKSIKIPQTFIYCVAEKYIHTIYERVIIVLTRILVNKLFCHAHQWCQPMGYLILLQLLSGKQCGYISHLIWVYTMCTTDQSWFSKTRVKLSFYIDYVFLTNKSRKTIGKHAEKIMLTVDPELEERVFVFLSGFIITFAQLLSN